MYTGLSVVAFLNDSEMTALVSTAKGAVGNQSGALANHRNVLPLADLRTIRVLHARYKDAMGTEERGTDGSV